MGLFTKKDNYIFKDYFEEPYKRAIKSNKDLYTLLESTYVSKVGILCIALLLDMEIKNEGKKTIIYDPYTGKSAEIIYRIERDNLDGLQIADEQNNLKSVLNFLSEELYSISEDKKAKDLAAPVGTINYILSTLEREITDGGDYAMDKFVALINNAEAKLLWLRKETYDEEKDIIYSAAARTLSGVMYQNCFKGTMASARSIKMYQLAKRQLSEEFYMLGRSREQMVDYLAGPVETGESSGLWAYVRQMKRIRECPEMW